ncbi:hypothetical protein PoB_003205600 [Plakobranchus ocellatus]|uniref:Uncharacterized protein n=1 Tax=Plakobranchus ocellatus TaxID=259542 RepID=A0AAV4AFZ1_9GAST|nr:hypothetical protein PoB_003205600 [Plakobranchus ocellatus]
MSSECPLNVLFCDMSVMIHQKQQSMSCLKAPGLKITTSSFQSNKDNTLNTPHSNFFMLQNPMGHWKRKNNISIVAFRPSVRPGHRWRNPYPRQKDTCRSQSGFTIHCTTDAPGIEKTSEKSIFDIEKKNSPYNLHRPFYRGFEARYGRPGLTEGLKA